MAEKTEEPTPKKLRDARKKGQIAKSKDVPSVMVIVTAITLLITMSDFLLDSFKSLLVLPDNYIELRFYDYLKQMLPRFLSQASKIALPFLIGCFLAALIGNLMQTGFLFSVEPIIPKLEKLSMIKGFKRIFSMKGLFEFIKSIIKVIFLSLIVWYVVYDNLDVILSLRYADSNAILPVIGYLIKKLFLFMVIGFIIIAVVDYLFEKKQYIKELKMTKDEVKREYKDSEGNPEIKGERKRIHQEMNESPSTQNVNQSSAVVTNPTHLAISLYYKLGITDLPVVLAKGSGKLAEKIKYIAEEHKVPIIQEISLARALMEEADVNDYIPAKFIKPVAEILRWAEQIKAEQDLDLKDIDI
jgi:type III secretion protein U